MSVSQPVLTADQILEITKHVNNYRILHQVPIMNWNPYIANFSNTWANQLLSNNMFQHSGNKLYGENLAYFQGYSSDVMTLLKTAIDAWYNEVKLYDYTKPGFSDKTGHFTCLVWKNSNEFGMGISVNTSTDTVDVVMNTSPPGNVIGEFQKNVFPIINIITPVPEPVPLPAPAPVPVPLPAPAPAPVPKPNNMPLLINNIINTLNNVLFMLRNKKPKYFIIRELQNVVYKLSDNADVASHINSIIFYIKTNRPFYFISNAVLQLINKLQTMY